MIEKGEIEFSQFDEEFKKIIENLEYENEEKKKFNLLI